MDMRANGQWLILRLIIFENIEFKSIGATSFISFLKVWAYQSFFFWNNLTPDQEFLTISTENMITTINQGCHISLTNLSSWTFLVKNILEFFINREKSIYQKIYFFILLQQP